MGGDGELMPLVLEGTCRALEHQAASGYTVVLKGAKVGVVLGTDGQVELRLLDGHQKFIKRMVAISDEGSVRFEEVLEERL